MSERNLPADIAATKAYYRTNTLFSCGHCRNFHNQIKACFPLLTKFLKELGVDAASPDEVMTGPLSDGLVHCDACYTVCATGKAEPCTRWLREGDVHLELTIQNGFLAPNEQTGEYFSIMVWGIRLPWALEEPFSGQP